METLRPFIIFKLEYLRGIGWGAISNFITKFSENRQMEPRDVEVVSSLVLKGKWTNNFSLIKRLDHSNEEFLSIKKPEKIYEVREKYDYIFFISIEYRQLFDVVDLQNFYLIWDSCRHCRIVALISGEQGDYHKTSQFFSMLTRNRESVYESLFFKFDKIKHLQLSRIGVLSKFLPLVPVDASMDKLMRQNVSEMIPAEMIEDFLRGEGDEKNVSSLLSGACRKLSGNYEKLKKCETKQSAAYLGKVNMLSFLLFCFLLEGNEEGFLNFAEFSSELQKIAIWANGSLQLIENIIFHSCRKRGAFSFRILENDNIYVKEKYALGEEQEQWLEFMITDYPGFSETLNIADKFRGDLSEPKVKEAFENLRPRDFFVDSKDNKIRKAWEQYYSEKKNVINHYGLKIFQRTVQRSNGHFFVQSFSKHHPQKDELYYDNGNDAVHIRQFCLPGTCYSILFPIKTENKIEKFDDYGIEDCEYKINNRDHLFYYEVINKELPIKMTAVTSQEKADFIEKIALYFLDFGESKEGEKQDREGKIICVNAKDIQGDMAEIIYKAIILAMLQSTRVFHIVLHECQQEFVWMFLDASFWGWRNLSEDLSGKGGKQIALYTAEYYEEIIILPESWNDTLLINHSNNFSRETRWKNYFEKWYYENEVKQSNQITKYPFDILAKEKSGDTIFEMYVKTVISRSIQSWDLGCKIENTHMRLGSTIHVNHFYEAEVLFGNSLFVERFALLIIKSMLRPSENDLSPIQASDRITLYGYTNYSEQTVFCTMQFLRRMLPGIDVDYAILERETENRGFTHIDRIRYSTYFEEGKIGKEKRKEYFQSRKIVCVIPIASTLKTNEKMINLFIERNGKECKASFWRNFELILVGSVKENRYWVKQGKRILGKQGMEIFPSPEFFVEVTLEYMEPLECDMCFPEQIIDEEPLIEANAASTIPNQAFGMVCEERMPCRINGEEIHREEQKLEILRNVVLYCHLERNANHFLFYFQTERLLVEHSKEIIDWLNDIKSKIKIPQNDYVVLICPAHFSNAGFIEYVNSCVFGNAAVVIRDDVDKEYRCNFRAKFSNLRKFVQKMADYETNNIGLKRHLHLFYVDDVIITGRTFQRARSLAQSIIEDFVISERQKYAVFDGIFVLIDRNSGSSRWQYTGIKEENCFYAFRTVHISSIRNHGDACVYCNLANEADTLKRSSVTKEMERYWRSEEKKFSVNSLVGYLKEREELRDKEESGKDAEERKRRSFRRLICTNNSMIFLDERYHGNCRKEVFEQLMTLVLEGSRIHQGEETEYFLSYCKVLSRPFRVFDKAIKEAVFDFLLLVCLCTLTEKSYNQVIDRSKKKSYLKEDKIRKKILEIESFIKEFFDSEIQRQDLIKVLLKQLTEMKSNFIMRESNMQYILNYVKKIEEKDRNGFIQYYRYLMKKLTGVSSDTSKSLWLDQLFCKKEYEDLDEIQKDIYLENVWIYQDAIQKLSERVNRERDHLPEPLNNETEEDLTVRFIKFETEVLEEYITPYQFKDFMNLLQLYGMYSESHKLTDSGKIFVASNFLLHRFISSDFENGLKTTDFSENGNLTKVDYIAKCMKYIMSSKEVIIIMELDAEYDLWENKLMEQYNALLPDELASEKMILKPKKEYIILGSSEEKGTVWTIREKNVVKILQEFQKRNSQPEKEYLYDFKEKIFMWELGHTTEYPVYIFSVWEKSKQDGLSGIEWLNRIRSVMQYYWYLNNSVFNRTNEGFFYELARQRKKNALHSKQKAHTHTKNDIKLEQYNHMLAKNKYGDYYQSDLLMLLADLNVSEHYRHSLTMDYYFKGVPYQPKQWDSPISLFAKMQEFYIINSDMEKAVKLMVSQELMFDEDFPLREDEEIVSFDYTNAEREVFLLMYSLMINAAIENRGRIENNCVTVYCSKTSDGRLRIANQVGESKTQKEPAQVMEELKYPPEEDNQGISLWSMSRYIKWVVASILDEKIKVFEKNKGFESNREWDPMEYRQLKRQILRLLGEEFQIFVEERENNGKVYFSIMVPILAEKFKDENEERDLV
ncbi:hypothetical protein D7X87_10005 [bacterium D16-54]|nr:hypothetical protein D7X87_10005 [bacterium D16-54]RKJ14677.1 hypothetical protein D7X65_10600 [bacterium D16-56]